MRLIFTSLLLPALLSACGGGSSGGPLTSPAFLTTMPDMTKGVREDFLVRSAPRVGLAASPGSLDEWRGFYAFSLEGIPAGAIITDALMHFRQTATVGTPFQTLNDFIAFHMDLGTQLDPATHFDGPKLNSGNKLDGDALTVNRIFDATATVQDDLDNGRPTSGYRFEFELPGGPLALLDYYVDLDDPTDPDYAGPAMLEVHWTMP